MLVKKVFGNIVPILSFRMKQSKRCMMSATGRMALAVGLLFLHSIPISPVFGSHTKHQHFVVCGSDIQDLLVDGERNSIGHEHYGHANEFAE
jgi:hypothetical protein